MQSRLRVLLVTSLSLIVLSNFTQAQTPATGSVVISGSLLGPVYPCGSSLCPTYDSGQVTVKVGSYVATAPYGSNGGTRAEQLAMAVAAQLNSSASPVTAVRTYLKLTLISKQTGTTANYPLTVAVNHSTFFPTASFTAVASGSTLTGGTGASSGGGSSGGSTG